MPRGRPKGSINSTPYVRYSVYNRRTDFPVIIGGTARECAAAMRITLESFYTIYTKLKNRHHQATGKWEIYRDDADDLEEAI